MTHTRDSLVSAARQYGENNDCTVKAAAVVTGLSYDEAHEAMRKQGRRKGRGLVRAKWEAGINSLGFRCVNVSNRFRGRTVRTIERELRRRPSNEKYLIHVRRHVLAWNGVEIVDWSKGRLHRVEYVLQVVPMETQPVVRKFVLANLENMYMNTIAIGQKDVAATLRKLTNGDVEFITPPPRVNREKFIKEFFMARKLPRGTMGVVELKGDAAVNFRKANNVRGKVFTVFGYKGD